MVLQSLESQNLTSDTSHTITASTLPFQYLNPESCRTTVAVWSVSAMGVCQSSTYS